jgi:high-affinity K+ transport system ATPase subunit B
MMRIDDSRDDQPHASAEFASLLADEKIRADTVKEEMKAKLEELDAEYRTSMCGTRLDEVDAETKAAIESVMRAAKEELQRMNETADNFYNKLSRDQ